MPPVETLSLPQYADRFAGGPGAIYIDDLNQLAGPSVYPEFIDRYGISLGDDSGNVPLYALQQHQWIYESNYYQSLLAKARLTDPTELVSQDERIIIEHACINRALLQCQLLESYFVPNVLERTNGQVIIQLTSFPELGMSGIDTAELLANGTMPMAELYGGYIGYHYPVMAMPNLWGLWPDHRTHFAIHTGIAPDMDRVVSDVIDSQPLMRNWIAGDDQYIFSDRSLDTPTDFRNLKTRSHSAELSDWIESMGADRQFVSLAEVYLALERNILEASVAGANVGLSQRWYEVTSHINGPLYSFSSTINAINGDVWHYIPQDLQQILIEEGAKHELESLRLASIQNLTGLQRNIDAGLEFVEFSPEIRNQAFRAARENVLPGWLRRLEYPERNKDAVDLFNNKIGPIVGLRIATDGSIVTTPITAGPHAGKTMAEVLSEVPPATILPPPIPQPTPTPTPRPMLALGERLSLPQYADRFAGGPGAIYVGDLNQLAGPSIYPGLGDDEGNVPLYALQQHQWIYESDYYQSLLAKASLTNPTELVSQGEHIEIRHVCVNRVLLSCRLLESYFVPNVAERTNGQVSINITSFPELGLSGQDTGEMLADGILDMANVYPVYPVYALDEYPITEMQTSLGLWPDQQTHYEAQISIAPELEQTIVERMYAKVLMHNWYAGNDQFFFTRNGLNDTDDFRDITARSYSASLSNWINGMGGKARFVAFSDVYRAIEQGIINAAVTSATAGYGLRWHEVTDYINGPLYVFLASPNAINKDVWNNLPQDIQQILIEEGAKYELETLRLASIENLTGLQNNIDVGLKFVEFSPEIRNQGFRVVRESVIPGWLQRLGYPQDNHYSVDLFNEKIGPIVGLRIEPDGTVTTIPITQGPHAGKTMEQVLSE